MEEASGRGRKTNADRGVGHNPGRGGRAREPRTAPPRSAFHGPSSPEAAYLLSTMPLRPALFVLAAALAVLVGCDDAATSEPATWRYTGDGEPLASVPAERLERLGRGVNLGGWFSQATITPEHLATFVTRDDARQIRALGFRHVRLPFDPAGVLDGSAGSDARLVALDDALDLLLAEDLAVIVDLHPTDAYKADLRAGGVDRVARTWNALAHRLARRDPDRVFFELLNEPTFESGAAWEAAQARLAEAVRAAAPRHTILATGPTWSAPDEIAALRPLADPNVVYAVHVYAPHTFTHQGATWGWPPWALFRNLPYPSSPEAVAEVLGDLDPSVRAYAETYGEARWDRDRMRAELRPAVDWAARHGVPLVCTEFGVFRPVAPDAARQAWLRDARVVFEESGVGWSVWDYGGGFGVTTGPPGDRTPDQAALDALGL